jgi:hypothetical protein
MQLNGCATLLHLPSPAMHTHGIDQAGRACQCVLYIYILISGADISQTLRGEAILCLLKHLKTSE